MKKILVTSFIAALLLLALPSTTFAQGMMWGYQGQSPPSASDLQEQQSMQDAGQKINQDLQNNTITCQSLTSDDYEKLGEYYMGQAAGDTQSHVYWDKRIQSMMGESGDVQMHIIWGQRGSGCLADTAIPSNTPSFISGMMGGSNYNNQSSGGGVYSMMGFNRNGNFMNGWGVLVIIIPVLSIVFLTLGIIYFWRGIANRRK